MKSSVAFQGLEPHQLASQISDFFTSWQNGRNKWLTRVKEVIQYVYATSTRETSNVANPWSHSTVIPKLTQIADTLAANYAQALFGRREFFTFEPAQLRDADLKKRKAIVNYLATKHDYNGFRATMEECLNDWIQTGNCFARVEYVVVREMDSRTKVEYIVYQGPKPIRISPYDMTFNHVAATFADTPKIFRESITMGELARRLEGPEAADYDVPEVERLMKFRNTVAGMKDAEINKSIQLTMDGFTNPAQYFRSGMVELLHFVGDIWDSVANKLEKSKVITVVDRRCVVRNKTLDDYQGMGRIYHAAWRKRTDNLYGQGPLDNLVGMQYLINHLENARADGFDQMLAPDRVFIGNVEVQKDGPVTTYLVDEVGGDVRNLAPDSAVLNADNQIALKEAQMEAYAGAPREAMGIRSPGEKTAFEVQRLENAASRLFQTKIEQFEQAFVEPILNGELEIAVRNLNVADVAIIMDEDFGVAEFLSITADDLMAKGTLKARGAAHYAKRAQLVQELQQFGNVLQGDQAMAVHFPAKARAKAWNDALGFDRLNLYKPFGAIEEQVELQQTQQAAASMMDEYNAAEMGDAATTDRAAGAAGQLAGL